MIKTAEYIQFEEGFLKEAGAHGCDVDFLRGYIKQADDIVEIWKNAFDEMAEKSKDPLYHYKLAQEIMYFNTIRPELEKKADLSSITNGYQKFLGGMNEGGMAAPQEAMQNFATKHQSGAGGGIMKWLADSLHNNPNMLSSLTTGAGGGGLLGLLLGALMGHPGMGMMLGGLGGAGLSAFMGNQSMQNSAKSFMSGQPKELNTNQVNSFQQGAGPVSETHANNLQDPAHSTEIPHGQLLQGGKPPVMQPHMNSIQPPVQKPATPPVK